MTEPPTPFGAGGPEDVPPDPSSTPPPGYPPAGGYPPPGGYQAAGPAPVGYANQEDKTWALIAHFGGAAGMLFSGVLGWVAPLIALLVKGNQSPTVRAHAVSALNFQLLWSIIGAVGMVLWCVFIGVFVTLVVIVIGIVFGVIAGIKANEGQLYKYPMTVNMVK